MLVKQNASFKLAYSKRSINYALARGGGADARRALYDAPSSMFRKRSIDHALALGCPLRQ